MRCTRKPAWPSRRPQGCNGAGGRRQGTGARAQHRARGPLPHNQDHADPSSPPSSRSTEALAGRSHGPSTAAAGPIRLGRTGCRRRRPGVAAPPAGAGLAGAGADGMLCGQLDPGAGVGALGRRMAIRPPCPSGSQCRSEPDRPAVRPRDHSFARAFAVGVCAGAAAGWASVGVRAQSVGRGPAAMGTPRDPRLAAFRGPAPAACRRPRRGRTADARATLAVDGSRRRSRDVTGGLGARRLGRSGGAP